ncbi:MAG TPA: hypothetical protein VN598_08130 [Usitatibacter sp.]|nr:hypothetical protein [Usitatibacter sp.]
MARAFAVSALAFSCAAAFAAHAAPVTCGGVGSDARAELEAASKGANLALEFFAGKRGQFIADVDVTITPVGGGDAFSTTAEGPLCFAHVAPGRYRIEARYKGATRLANATVGNQGQAHVAVGFPESVAEPDPGPISAEEKRQASTP